jgi:hypothetical protein
MDQLRTVKPPSVLDLCGSLCYALDAMMQGVGMLSVQRILPEAFRRQSPDMTR